MLTSSYGPDGQKKDYNVYRSIGSYSDDRINFYTERYYYDCAWNDDGTVIAFGYTTFVTIDIYENTLLSQFVFKQNVNYGNNSINVSGTKDVIMYNTDLNITNLGNTLYFSNYNLSWKEDSQFPLVATCSDSYLNINNRSSSHTSNTIGGIFNWYSFSKNFGGEHGSINTCLTEVIHLDGNSSLNIGSLSTNNAGLSFTYKYYINNPTYEIIDLPNVMLSILTMPFTFFSQAFNLTLFPNTPYAINVGHTILIVVGVIGAIYLIKYLVSIFKG